MKKYFPYILLAVFIILGISAIRPSEPIPANEQALLQHKWFNLDGHWLPDLESAKIGPNNLKTAQNIRPVGGGWEGVNGDTKINTTAIPINAIAQEIENGIHFKKDQPSESHVIVSAGKSGVTQIFKNDTAIPDAGDFSGTTLYSIDTSAEQVRLSNAPGGNVVVCDGKESLFWGGDEMRVAGFITSEAGVTNDTINPRDYTQEVNNTLSTADEVAVIGGGNDNPWTKSLLHFDGIDGSTTFTDSNSGSAGTHTWTVDTTAVIDTDQKKFGTGSGYFDGGTSIWAADSVDWTISASTTWTMDLWLRVDPIPSTLVGVFQQHEDAQNYVQLYTGKTAGGAQPVFYVVQGGVQTVSIASELSDVLSYDTWHHVAIIKGWGGDEDVWAMTIDGKEVGQTTPTADITFDFTGNFEIGVVAWNIASGVSYYFNGWTDEFRWTKGKARWESDFTSPPRPYSAEANNWVMFTTRPISGALYYVADGSSLSGQTVTHTFWNGSSWTGVSVIAGSGDTNDPTFGLSQSGKISWSSTVDTAKPIYLENRLFYATQGTLSDGEATIYNVTVDAPMQPIVDLWDGVDRECIGFHVVTSSGTSDYTARVNEPTLEPDWPVVAEMGGVGATDETILIFEDRLQALRFEMFDVNETAISSGASIYYWSGSEYVSVSNQYDETDQDGTPLNKSGVVSWSPPGREEEFRQTLYGETGYAYKIVWNGTLDSTGSPSQTSIDLVYGIPAPLKVRPFKFSFPFKNRVMLGGYTEGNEGNRIDYSMTNAPGVWNGEESSMDGLQSIRVKGNEELTAGKQLYNQYGNKLITLAVLYKQSKMFALIGDGPTGDDKFKILPISENIGCPAPLTLVSVEVGYAAQGQPARNIHLFLSYAGPYRFEGTAPAPIHGIDSYFDPNHANYVGAANIENAHGWYDRTYKEYNLRVSTHWFVYSLIQEKWFPKYSPTMPTVGFSVTDTNGSSYIYSGTTTGYLMRQEYGTTWGETGTGIEQIARTGDFYPENNDPWWWTELLRYKVGYKVLSEAATLNITHYRDSATTGESLTAIKLNEGDNTYNRKTFPFGTPKAWSHALEFDVTTSATEKGAKLLGYGYQWQRGPEDDN